MKNPVLLFVLLVFSLHSFAQPTLTGATSNPVIGDVFYNNLCNSDGVVIGAAGAGITWDYSALIDTLDDTTRVVPCTSTPYCDSFPGTMFAEIRLPDSVYIYCTANASHLSNIGGHFALSSGGVGYLYCDRPENLLRYPINYGASWMDTTRYWYHPSFAYSHVFYAMNYIADGYGTLITPFGTFADVIRLHLTTYTTDSDYTTGTLQVFYYRSETYYWYKPGFHFSLLQIGTENDITTDDQLSIDMVEYSSGPALSGVREVNYHTPSITVFPNPSKDAIHIRSNNGHLQDLQMTLYDMTGREILTSITSQNPDEVTIPVSSFPAGVYILKVQNSYGSVIKKVEVE